MRALGWLHEGRSSRRRKLVRGSRLLPLAVAGALASLGSSPAPAGVTRPPGPGPVAGTIPPAPWAGQATTSVTPAVLAAAGYQQQEFFVSGTAHAYDFARPATADGAWKVTPVPG